MHRLRTRVAAELVGADLQRDLPAGLPMKSIAAFLLLGAEQVKVVERALVRDGEAVLARARVPEVGAVRALEQRISPVMRD